MCTAEAWSTTYERDSQEVTHTAAPRAKGRVYEYTQSGEGGGEGEKYPLTAPVPIAYAIITSSIESVLTHNFRR